MTSYNCLFIIAVCKRCEANLATLSKKEPDLVDNDGDNLMMEMKVTMMTTTMKVMKIKKLLSLLNILS